MILYISEGSSEVKLPTVWTDKATEVGEVREDQGRKRRSEKRKAEERRSRRTKR
jgi:hypothetical protein